MAKFTILTELQRVQTYTTVLAQQYANQKRKHCGFKTVLDVPLKHLVKDHLRLTWSPTVIATKFKLATASI